MKKIAKTATDRKGSKIKAGDYIQCFGFKGEILNRCLIIEIYKQGYDGTILTVDPVPNPEFPFHNSVAAKYTEKI